MFSKIPTHEEEREMQFIEATALEVHSSSVSETVKSFSKFPIPRHLKRVNSSQKPSYMLVLMSLGPATLPGFTTVLVPAFEPITKKQYDSACSVWPCNFYNHFEQPLDQDLAFRQVRTFLSHLETTCLPSFCCGLCMIFDHDVLLSTNIDSELILGHAILKSVSDVSRSKRGYLCTGYTAILYEEPCLSCAMALVHGRIKNVILIKKVQNRAFSHHRLNYNKYLNHRYNVYLYNS